ncbi:glycosyltransferase family 39 protein [Kineococcus sp. TRM81007]|uniref:glycosyltransferase family 39 protein n=1 Tax=Kineococcus sp. TRM81007 TaxID=2925831 RepID=UPI0027E32221|nr:glycosyltransferase family 39 protein [Kineococcus sp. TRM81007]
MPTAPVAPRSRAGRGVALLAVAAVALFAFCWRLGVETSSGDELVYRDTAAAYLRGDFTRNLEHPPLAKLLIAAGHAAGGGSLVADRAVPALCGVLTAVVLFAVARRCAGFRAGVLAALLWSALPLAPGVVPAHLDRRATLEAPLLLFSACAVLAAQRVAQRPSPARWALLGAAVGAATASKLTGAVTAVVVLALLWEERRRWRPALVRAVLAGAVSVVVFLAAYLPFGADAPAAVRTVVLWQLDHADRGAVQSVAGEQYRFPPWWSPWWFQAQYLTWLGLVALWGTAAVGAVLTWWRAAVRPVVLLLVAFTAAVAMSPLKLPQYHDVLVPPLCALAAVGFTRLLRRRGVAGAVVGSVAAAPLLVVAAGHLADVAATRPADYRLAADLLRERGLAGPGGAVVVWGDAEALRRLLPGVEIATGTDVDCSAAALVVDPTVADRMTGADVAAWVAGCGVETALRADRLAVHLLP